MDYKAQLKGWCVEKAIAFSGVTSQKIEFTDMIERATAIFNHVYDPGKDFKSCIRYAIECLESAKPEDGPEELLSESISMLQAAHRNYESKKQYVSN